MTKPEADACEQIANQVMWYRAHNNFLHAPCWMDEWALGYFCAMRDLALINTEQWEFLCRAFQPDL
jgi:hypothetical protein